jgi:hypothetical protein
MVNGVIRMGMLCVFSIPLSVYAEDVKSKEKVKETVERYLQARDVDQLLKEVDLPWLAEGERIIEDDKDLRKHLQPGLEKGDGSRRKLEVLEFVSGAKIETMVEDEAARKLLGRVVGKEDQLVFVGNKDSLVFRYVLVRLRGGNVKVVGGPYPITYLLMPNRIPNRAREALARADGVEVLSLDPERQKEKPTDGFHGWKVLGRTVVKDEETRKKVLAAFQKSIEESEGLRAACFKPRHGLRLHHQGKTLDLVICFECFQVHVDEGNEGFLITASAQPVMDKVLVDAGVPRPQK